MKIGPANMKEMLKQAQKMKEELEHLQNEAGEKTVEASAGGGMVTVVAKAKGEIVSVKIDPSIIEEGDIEMVQDLVVAAVNEALNRGRELLQQEIGKVAASLGLPPGLL